MRSTSIQAIQTQGKHFQESFTATGFSTGQETFDAIQHVAIIPDGNRRWAIANACSKEQGHRKAFLEVSPQLISFLFLKGVKTVTLWLFSTENWQREPVEIEYLMSIYESFLALMREMAQELGFKMVHLGDQERLPRSLIHSIEQSDEATRIFTQRQFNYGINYGGKQDLITAINHCLAKLPFGELLEERHLNQYFEHRDSTTPDLIIRTSGEIRNSGFMLWQAAYSEYFFVPKLYPDTQPEDLEQILVEFSNKRKRRYGK